MRICQVLCGSGYGGLERHVLDLASGLAERGHEVTLVASPAYAELLAPGVRHEPLDLTGWRFSPVLLLQLLLVLGRVKPDIVHAQANKAAAMVALVAPWLSARTVATVHNLKQRTGAFRRFDGAIAVSRVVADQLQHDFVRVIHNGIRPQAVAPATDYTAAVLARPLRRPLALAVGRLVPAKGFDLLIEAWVGLDATLVIAGEGPEHARLEALIRDKALQGRVLLAGYRDDVSALLADADLVVISSRREGFPYAMVEALHARKIIVATRVPGANEVLPAGYVVDREDVQALTAGIRAALADLPRAKRDYAQAWRYAAEELTVASMVAHTEDFYRAVLAQ